MHLANCRDTKQFYYAHVLVTVTPTYMTARFDVINAIFTRFPTGSDG